MSSECDTKGLEKKGGEAGRKKATVKKLNLFTLIPTLASNFPPTGTMLNF